MRISDWSSDVCSSDLLVAGQLELGDDAHTEIFRRMAFNVMARNCDDHTKNHAFLLREGGRWELAPAYDVTHAYNPNGEWTYQHLMGVNGKFNETGRATSRERVCQYV